MDADNRLTKDGEIERVLKASRTSYQVCQGESPDEDHLMNPLMNPVDSGLVRSTTKEEAIKKIQLGVKHKDNKWHWRFLNMIKNEISQWSHDPSTKCGSIIVDKKQRIQATGYNGFPRGVEDTPERLANRQLKYDLTIHAEMNAILFAEKDLSGHTLYVYPIPPCVRCACMIIQAGIKRVVTIKMSDDAFERWGGSVELSKMIFDEAEVEYIELEDINP